MDREASRASLHSENSGAPCGRPGLSIAAVNRHSTDGSTQMQPGLIEAYMQRLASDSTLRNSDFLLSISGSSNPEQVHSNLQPQDAVFEYRRVVDGGAEGSAGRATHRSDHEGNLNAAPPQERLSSYHFAAGMSSEMKKRDYLRKGLEEKLPRFEEGVEKADSDMGMDLDARRICAPPSVESSHNPQHPRDGTGLAGYTVPPSLAVPPSPLIWASPRPSSGPSVPFSPCTVNPSSQEKPKDVLQAEFAAGNKAEALQEYLQASPLDGSKLAQIPKAKMFRVHELEEMCIRYAKEVEMLKSIVADLARNGSTENEMLKSNLADLEARSEREAKNIAQELEATFKEFKIKDSHTKMHGNDREMFASARAFATVDLEMVSRLPLPAQLLLLRDIFNKKIERLETFLIHQTEVLSQKMEANNELANRIQDLEVMTKFRVQKDAELMGELRIQLREQEAMFKVQLQKDAEYKKELENQIREEQMKSASLRQTTEDQQTEIISADKVFRDWIHLRVNMPKRIALPFGRWALLRHVNARALVAYSRASHKLHIMQLIPFFVVWLEFTARGSTWRNHVSTSQMLQQRKCRKRAFNRWCQGLLTARRSRRWCKGKAQLVTLVLKKSMFDKWCEDTYISIIKSRATYRTFPRGIYITDNFTIKERLLEFHSPKRIFSSASVWKMAHHTMSLMRIQNLLVKSKALGEKRRLSSMFRMWAGGTKFLGFLYTHINTWFVQSVAHLRAHAFDAWRVVRACAYRRHVTVCRCRAHHMLRLLSDTVQDWWDKVQRRIQINKVQTNAILKRFMLQCSILKLWVQAVRKSALRKRKLFCMRSRLQISICIVCWRTWSTRTKRSRNIQRLLSSKTVKRWLLSIQASFMQWKDMARALRSMKSAESKIVQRWMRHFLETAFMQWVSMSSLRTVHSACSIYRERIFMQFFQKFKGLRIRQSMMTWAECASLQKRLNMIGRKILNMVEKRYVRKVFVLWAHQVAKYKKLEKTDIVNFSMVHHCKTPYFGWGQSKSFAQWKRTTRANMRMRFLSSKIVKRRILSMQASALVQWKEMTREQVGMKRVESKIVQRWMQHSLATAFMQWWRLWEVNVKELRHQQSVLRRQQNILEKMAMRMRSADMYKGWVRWEDQWRQKKKMRRSADKAASRWRNVLLAPAFLALKASAKEVRRLRNAGAKVMLRWQRLGLSNGFSGWSEHAATQRRMTIAAEKIMSPFLQTPTAACMRARRTSLPPSMHMGENSPQYPPYSSILKSPIPTRGAFGGLKRSEKYSSPLRGVHFGARMKRVASKVVQLWRQLSLAEKRANIRMRFLSSKIVKRRILSMQASALVQWKEMTREQVGMKRVESKIVQRWMQHSLATAFMQWWRLWEVNVKELRHQQSVLRRQQNILEKMAMRMRSVDMYKGWVRWEDQWRQKKKMRRSADKAASRWRNVLLAPAFLALKASAKEVRRLRNAGAKVMLRWQRLGLSNGFSGWSEHAATQRRMTIAAEKVMSPFSQTPTAACMRARRTSLPPSMHMGENSPQYPPYSSILKSPIPTRGAFGGLKRSEKYSSPLRGVHFGARMKRVASKVVQLWRQLSLAEKRANIRMRFLSSKIVKRRILSMQASALVQWKEMTREQVGMKRVESKIVQRWMQHSLATAFMQWWRLWEVNVKELRHQQSVLRRQQNILEKMAMRMRSVDMYKGWVRWEDQWRQKKKMRRSADKAASRWRNVLLAPAFLALKASAKEVRRLRNAGAKVMLRWQRLGLSNGFSGWSEHAATQRRMTIAAEKVMSPFSQTPTAACMRARRTSLPPSMHMGENSPQYPPYSSILKSPIPTRGAFGGLKRSEKYSSPLRGVHFGARMKRVASKVVQLWRQLSLAEKRANIRMRFLSSKIVKRRILSMQASALVQWKEMTREQVGMKRVESKIVQRWMQHSLATAFMQWWRLWEVNVKELRHQQSVLRRQQNILEKMAMRMRSADMYKGWVRWEDQWRQKKKMRRSADKAASRWRNVLLAPAFLALKASAKEVRRLRNAGAKVMLRWQRLGLSNGFSGWSEHAATQRRMTIAAEKIMSPFLQTPTAACMRARRTSLPPSMHMGENSPQYPPYSSILKSPIPTRGAFGGLKRSEKYSSPLRGVHFGARMKRVASKVVQLWRQLSLAEKRANIRMRFLSSKIVKRRILSMQASALVQWKEMTREQVGMKRVESKIVQRWMQHSLATAFMQFRRITSERTRMKADAITCARRLLDASLMYWQSRTVVSKKRMFLFARQLNLQRCFFHIRIIQKIFNIWSVSAKLTSHQRLAIEVHAALAFAIRLQSFCLLLWAHKLKCRRLQMHTVDGYFFQKISAQLVSVLKEWLQEARHLKLLCMGISRLKKYRAAHNLRWATLAWREHSCSEAINKTLQHKTKIVIFKMMHRCMIWTFAHWTSKTREIRRMRFVSSKIVKRWILSIHASALMHWQNMTREQRGMERVKNKIVSRMRTAGKYKAWASWRDNAKQLRHQRNLLGKIALRIRNAGMYKAWSSWHDNAKELKRRLAVIEKIGMRLRSVGMYKGWVRWEEQWRQEKKMRRSADKAASRWRNVLLAPAFLALKASAKEVRRLRTLGAKVMLRWQRLGLPNGFSGWSEHVATQRRMTIAAEKIMLRWQNMVVAAAYSSWNDHMKERVHEERVLKKMALRMRAGMYKAWASWHAHTKQLRHQRNLLGKIALRIRNAGMYKAWSSWHDNAKELKRRLAVIEKIGMRLRSVGMYKGWVRWEEQWRQEKKMRRSADKAASRWRNVLLAPAFLALKASAKEVRRLRTLGAKVMLRWQRLGLPNGFYGWSEHVATQRRMTIAAEKIMLRWQKMVVAAAYSSWNDHVKVLGHKLDKAQTHITLKHNMEKLQRVCSRNAALSILVLRSVIMLWKDIISRLKHLFCCCSSLARQCAHVLLRASMHEWHRISTRKSSRKFLHQHMCTLYSSKLLKTYMKHLMWEWHKEAQHSGQINRTLEEYQWTTRLRDGRVGRIRARILRMRSWLIFQHWKREYVCQALKNQIIMKSMKCRFKTLVKRKYLRAWDGAAIQDDTAATDSIELRRRIERYTQILESQGTDMTEAALRRQANWRQITATLMCEIASEILEWESKISDACHSLSVSLEKVEKTENAGGGKEGRLWVQSCRLVLRMLVPPFRLQSRMEDSTNASVPSSQVFTASKNECRNQALLRKILRQELEDTSSGDLKYQALEQIHAPMNTPSPLLRTLMNLALGEEDT